MDLKPDWNRIAFALATVAVVVGVVLGKVPVSVLGALIPWLMPTPLKPVSTPQGGSVGQ